MSLKDRIFNVAKAELKSAAKKVKDSVLGDTESDTDKERFEEEMRQHESTEETPRRASSSENEKIRRYYANLELPLGASAAEVKAAYRRLMRRYHPDLHHADDKRQEVATKLAQELRVAYEELLAHLEGKR